jgi:hypothetical protein
MALNIRNPEADRLATELAALSGESKRMQSSRRSKTAWIESAGSVLAAHWWVN